MCDRAVEGIKPREERKSDTSISDTMLQVPLRKDVIAFLIPVPVSPPLVPTELFSLIITLNNRWVVCPSDKHSRESLGLKVSGTAIGLFASHCAPLCFEIHSHHLHGQCRFVFIISSNAVTLLGNNQTDGF